MPQLVAPTVAVRDSYLRGERSMCTEEGTSTVMIDEAERDFERYVARRRLVRMSWAVPVTELWYVDGLEYIGTVVLRHELTPALAVQGAHVGFHVVPRFRRRGHATQMLAQTIGFGRDLGVQTLLITCAEANTGSRHVIEANGGVVLGVAAGTARSRLACVEDPRLG